MRTSLLSAMGLCAVLCEAAREGGDLPVLDPGRQRIASEDDIERAIVANELTAPRVTPAQIDRTIVGVDYHVFVNTTVTVCCIHLRNGFCVLGESAAASPENFNEVIGRQIAFKNAREKIWPLEGYLLRDRLHGDEQCGSTGVAGEASNPVLQEPQFDTGTPGT